MRCSTTSSVSGDKCQPYELLVGGHERSLVKRSLDCCRSAAEAFVVTRRINMGTEVTEEFRRRLLHELEEIQTVDCHAHMYPPCLL